MQFKNIYFLLSKLAFLNFNYKVCELMEIAWVQNTPDDTITCYHSNRHASEGGAVRDRKCVYLICWMKDGWWRGDR